MTTFDAMSLTDAFLLEPAPLNIWISYRTDELGGSGTQSDPFNGSTQERFDKVMASLPDNTPVRVHLGPCPRDIGTFEVQPFVTAGFWMSADGTVMCSAWKPKPGMVIGGAGREATYLKFEPGATAGTHYFAMGAPRTPAGGLAAPNIGEKNAAFPESTEAQVKDALILSL